MQRCDDKVGMGTGPATENLTYSDDVIQTPALRPLIKTVLKLVLTYLFSTDVIKACAFSQHPSTSRFTTETGKTRLVLAVFTSTEF